MAYTQAQMLSEFRENLGDLNTNERTDYLLIGALRRAYATAWPDWYAEIKDTSYTGYASLPAGTLHVDVPSSLVGGKIYNIFGRVNQYQQGTAFTAAAASPWFTTTAPYSFTNNQQVQVDGSIPTGLSRETLYYFLAPAAYSIGAISSFGPTFSTGVHTFQVGQAVTFTGLIPVNFAANTVYYIATVPSNITLTLSATRGGAAISANSSTSTTIALVTNQNFQLAATSNGAAISPTTAGSGYVGTYVDPTTDYAPFNQWTRGVRIDPLTETTPRIRFTRRDMTTFELRLEGAAQLSYPYVTVSAANSATFTVTGSSTGTTYTPFNGDTVYFWAVAPNSFTSGGTGVGGLTPYYVVNATSTTFQLASTSGGAAISTSSTGSFNIYPGSQTLTGTDYTWFSTFLLWQGEVFARAGLQRSGNLDRRAQAQRRLLAQQEADKCRSHRQQPNMGSQFRWDG